MGAATANIENPDYRIVHQRATDYDQDTCAIYAHNICKANLEDVKSVICKDIRKFDLHGLPEIDALAFGFPHNDYGVVGEQKRMNGVYDPLYSFGVNALKIFV